MEETGPSQVSRWMLGNKGILPEPGLYSIRLVQSGKGEKNHVVYQAIKDSLQDNIFMSVYLISHITPSVDT